MILENSKMKDVYESVLYRQVREAFDKECATAPEETRTALEALADLISDRVKCDSAACKVILEGKKTLEGAYMEMTDTVRKRVKQERGKVVCGTMTDAEAKKIALAYYGIAENSETAETEKESAGGDVKSIYDFL